MPLPKRTGICPCCGRRARLTFHHLIPRHMHRRTYFRKNYSREVLRQGIHICRQCHDGIHRFYSAMELAKRLNTLEKLQRDDRLAAHFAWVARQRIRLE